VQAFLGPSLSDPTALGEPPSGFLKLLLNKEFEQQNSGYYACEEAESQLYKSYGPFLVIKAFEFGDHGFKGQLGLLSTKLRVFVIRF